MNKPKKTHIKFKIIFTYSIAIAIASLIFYFIIPYLLNYGPDTINTEFDIQVSNGICYWQQILLGVSLLILFVCILLNYLLKDIDKYQIYQYEYKTNHSDFAQKRISFIKKVCLTLTNRILIIFIIIPLICSIAVLFMQTSYLTSSDFKLMLVIFILSTTTISLTNTYIRKLLSKILIELDNTDFDNVKKTGLTSKLLFQILPIMAVCIVFTYLAVSSIYEKNNADLLFNYYNNQFEIDIENSNIISESTLIDSLKNIRLYSNENILFVADENFNIVHKTGELSDFFTKYMSELSLKNDYRIYDYYGSTGQGVLYPVELNGTKYYIGAYYVIYASELTYYISIILLFLTVLCSLILYAFAKEISNNIKTVYTSLNEISNSNSFTEKKLYITSTDELGNLISVYNKIQNLTIQHLNQIKDNQESLMESERLASLGQLIGGIAHNLKTPIMSIAGAAEGLTDLIKEYDSSIEDPTVNAQDHHDIAKDMTEWVVKVKEYTEYMSDVITAVKGQAVVMSNEDDINFTVSELVKRVTILMKHELKNAIITLNTSVDVDDNLTLNGDVNNLVQVINNMISNAIQAYNGRENESIELIITKDSKNVIFIIQDHAGGLPAKVKDKLFKEMITTKGKNGTGLGLYMSYSTIKAHFNGDIKVVSKDGEGTKFDILIPYK